MIAIRWHDVTAGVIAVGLLVGIMLLVVLEREIPDLIANAFLVCLSWALRGGVHTANDLRHRNRGGNNA
jgi:small basic protein